MAYPPIRVVTANPQSKLVVRPLPPQPKVVVRPPLPQPKVSVVQNQQTTSKSSPPLQVAGPQRPYPTLKVNLADPNTLGPSGSNYLQMLQPSASAAEGVNNPRANLDTRVVGVDGTTAPKYKAPQQGAAGQYWRNLLDSATLPTRLARDVAQGAARTFASLLITPRSMFKGEFDKSGLTLTNNKLFGEGKTVEPLNVFAAQQREKGRDYLKEKGATTAGAEALGLGYAALSVGGALSDFLPGAGEIKTLSKLDDVNKITRILKKSGYVDSVIKDFAPVIARTSGEGEISAILKNMKRIQSVNPESAIKNINTTEKAGDVIRKNVSTIRSKLEIIKGGKITDKEVRAAAQKSDLLGRAISRDESLRNMAAIQRTRESLGAMAEGLGVSDDFIQSLKAVKSQASDAARKLRAFGIDAEPGLADTKGKIVAELLDLGYEAGEIIKAAEGVDFNNAKQVTKFYRKFVKPTFWDKLDEWRYGNMLSSPLTHIVNMSSNAIQTLALAPATKLVTGAIDNVGSRLLGREQQYFMREAPQYYRGVVNGLGQAMKNSWDAFRGNTAIEKLDLQKIGTNSKITAIHRQFLQALEASDVFFRTLVKEGEKVSLAEKYRKIGKEFTPQLLEKEAAETARYYVFRKGLDPANKEGQGAILSGIDKITAAVMKGRDNKVVGWFVPFVQTPMNILKQGIEYSPAGFLNLYKNEKKTESLAKALIGSTVLAGAGYLAYNNMTTWAAPSNEKEKELFYAAGMQPYSVKIGDKWFSYSKLGPLAYPIAMAAAAKYFWQDNPRAATESTAEKFGQIASGILEFFGDQSYVQGVTELADLVSGKPGSGMLKSFENLTSQGMPFSSLQRWINTMMDPIYRQSETKFDKDTIIKNLRSQLISQSDIKEAYKTPDGEDSKRQYPVINSINPFKVSKENPSIKEKFDLQTEISRLTALKGEIRDENKTRLEPVLDEVTRLENEGRYDEAQAIKDSLSEADWEIYKSIRTSRRNKEISDSKPEILKVYEQVTELEARGELEQAQAIKDALTEEEWSAYKSIRSLIEGTTDVSP